MSLLLRSAILLLLGIFFSGCTGESAPNCAATIEIGSGEKTFETIAENAALPIIQGPQGGFHFLVSLRATCLIPGNPEDLGDVDNPLIEFRAHRGTERVDLDAANFRQGIRSTGDGLHFEMVGRFLILDIRDDAELDNVPLRISVSVTDVQGEIANDERTIVGFPHPNNQ